MEKDWVDFRLVKQCVSMQMVLDHYHINGLRKNGDELRGRCPLHQGEGDRTLHINLSKNVFQCFSCKAKGNVLDFVAAMERCSVRDAALKLSNWFAVGESSGVSVVRIDKKPEETESAVINPTLPFTLRVDAAHEYGLSRGVTRETLEQFGAGLCVSKGTFAGRFVIPLHNEQGELVGYAGRSFDDSEPKYLFPSSEKHFYKSHLVYNLHRVLANQPSYDSVIIVEGFFGTMWIHQSGFPNVVGLLGSSMSQKQENLLCDNFKRAVLLLDGDPAGCAATDACLSRLGRRKWVKAITLPDGQQPDDLSAQQISILLNSVL